MNILFICSRNKWRSATAETIFRDSQHHNVKSAGTEPSAVTKVSAKSILWADIIFVMEKRHRERLTERFPMETLHKKMIILDIEDNFQYMDPELIESIRTSVQPHLDNF